MPTASEIPLVDFGALAGLLFRPLLLCTLVGVSSKPESEQRSQPSEMDDCALPIDPRVHARLRESHPFRPGSFFRIFADGISSVLDYDPYQNVLNYDPFTLYEIKEIPPLPSTGGEL